MKNKLLRTAARVGAVSMLLLSTVLAGCAKKPEASIERDVEEASVESVVSTVSEEREEEALVETESFDCKKGEVIVYFPNWNLNGKAAQSGGEVASIPWESITYVNHAFFEVYPADGTTETSFERKENGEPARTSFEIISTGEGADFEDEEESAVIPGLRRNHFSEYEYFSEIYPDVNIMISVGGWSDCGYFSEMAYTEEGRKSFVNSCVDLIRKYPWIDGIDIDWEYPAGSNDGQRYPENDNDEGCPIFGTPEEDRVNFASLMKCFRETLDAEFGEGAKKLTACASASTGWTLPNQDWASAAPYLDLINIMTYDLAGTWDGSSGLATSVQGAKGAILYFKVNGVPTEKLCIGAPMYATVWKIKEGQSININSQTEDEAPNEEEISMDTILQWENEASSGYTKVLKDGLWIKGEEFDNNSPGWHFKYHKIQGGVYMYNDDEASPYYGWYLSYENELTLSQKMKLINDYNLAGIIVWESSEDCADHTMINLMGDYLVK